MLRLLLPDAVVLLSTGVTFFVNLRLVRVQGKAHTAENGREGTAASPGPAPGVEESGEGMGGANSAPLQPAVDSGGKYNIVEWTLQK